MVGRDLQLRDCPEALRRAIESFAQSHAELRQAERSFTRCKAVSDEFAGHCQSYQLDAAALGSWADLLGFDLHDGHYVCLVTLDSRRITVDWTAAQYGRAEFPLIREIQTLPPSEPWLVSEQEGRDILKHLAAELEVGRARARQITRRQ